ncbi:MAG: phasin family protein [Jhaorihella sp.]
MTKAPKTPAAADPTPTLSGLESLAAQYPFHEAAFKAWFDMGAAALEFLSSRVDHDLQTQKAMLGCTCLEDVQKVQAEFCTRALEDYKSATARMMELMVAAAMRGPGGAAASARRGYDDVPL